MGTQRVIVDTRIPIGTFIWRVLTGQFIQGPNRYAQARRPSKWEKLGRPRRALVRWSFILAVAGLTTLYRVYPYWTQVGLLSCVPYAVHHGSLAVTRLLNRPHHIMIADEVPETPQPRHARKDSGIHLDTTEMTGKNGSKASEGSPW